MKTARLTVADVRLARERIAPHVVETPLLSARSLGARRGVELWFKAENLQRTGSFKVRGAFNFLLSRAGGSPPHGVITVSAGNHAQAVALAARSLGVTAHVVMPRTAPLAKIEATRTYGGRVTLWGDTFDEAKRHALGLAEAEASLFVPPFDDPAVAAGQGTLALEMLERQPPPDLVLVPVGGGGLAAGVAVVVKELAPHARVIGVQAEAYDAVVCRIGGPAREPVTRRDTLADGIAVEEPGGFTSQILEKYLDDAVRVSEEAIAEAILVLLERAKLVVEGAGAVGLAAFLSEVVPVAPRTICILSGGNVDVTVLGRIIERGLVRAGRYTRLACAVPDRPGALVPILDVVREAEANVLSIEHDRWGAGAGLGEARVEIALLVRGPEDAGLLRRRLSDRGVRLLPDLEEA